MTVNAISIFAVEITTIEHAAPFCNRFNVLSKKKYTNVSLMFKSLRPMAKTVPVHVKTDQLVIIDVLLSPNQSDTLMTDADQFALRVQSASLKPKPDGIFSGFA